MNLPTNIKNTLISFMAVSLISTGPLGCSKDSVINRSIPKVVEIHAFTAKGGKATCSGSFINDEGLLLTAKHCVEPFQRWEVITSDNQVYSATVAGISFTDDLALLQISRKHTPYFKLAWDVSLGDKIHIIGSPLGWTQTYSTGHIARLSGDITLVDMSLLPGYSGSAIFNDRGELVGVASKGFIVYFGLTHLNILVSLDSVKSFLKGII